MTMSIEYLFQNKSIYEYQNFIINIIIINRVFNTIMWFMLMIHMVNISNSIEHFHNIWEYFF